MDNRRLITLSVFLLSILIIPIMFNSCKTDGVQSPFVDRQGGGAGTSVIFADVLPVFKSRCMSCHSTTSPKWTEYDTALQFAENGKLIKRVILQKNMPKLGSPEANAMTDDERSLIEKWVKDGAKLNADDQGIDPPPGDGSDIPGPIWEVANQCANCHGDQSPNSNLEVPLLAGQNKEYLINQLDHFATGARQDATMGPIAESLTADEIMLVSLIYSSISVIREPVPEPEIPDKIKAVIGLCASCHMNPNNKANNPNYPNIAGQNKDYLITQLLMFKSGEREDQYAGKFMNELTKSMDVSTIEELSDYISKLRIKTED